MVSLATSKLCCSKLVLVEPGTKVDGSYYREELLSKKLLSAIRSIAGDLYVFGSAEIARPDKTAPDQTERLNNGGHEQSSP